MIYVYNRTVSGGKYVCSMDDLFGLPQKKVCRHLLWESLHREFFLCNQTSVDQFESDNVQSKVVSAVRICCTYSIG